MSISCMFFVFGVLSGASTAREAVSKRVSRAVSISVMRMCFVGFDMF